MSPRYLAIVATLALVGAAGCGAGAGADRTTGDVEPAASRDAASTTAEKPTPTIALHVRRPAVVQAPTVVIRGRSRPGAHVAVNGHRVKLDDRGRFERELDLDMGANDITVKASAPGYDPHRVDFRVRRRHTAAELAAIKERREQAAAQAEADFKASAVSIDYDQLMKNPDAHKGEHVVYHGQIFQIQDAGGFGIMLLSVTDEGYGIWDDHVWVDYAQPVQGAEDDFITVYGVVTGGKSYETQIGGETYVPRIRARYIEE
jgi:hypothetical protein